MEHHDRAQSSCVTARCLLRSWIRRQSQSPPASALPGERAQAATSKRGHLARHEGRVTGVPFPTSLLRLYIRRAIEPTPSRRRLSALIIFPIQCASTSRVKDTFRPPLPLRV